MADVGTPSAMAMSTSNAGAEASKDKAAPPAKPERPDEETYKNDLSKAEKDLRAAEDRMKQIKAKLDNSRPNNKDSPAGKRQQELRGELQQIRTQQQSSKSSRTTVMDKIKRLDENLKSRINEQKTARSKTQFKSVDDLQKEIDRLQKQVDSGTMKIVDEKKALAEVSQLNRQKKAFGGFEDAEKGISDVKAQIAELRKTMDDPESRAMSDRYTAITTELDSIKAEQDDAFKNLNALRDERTKAHEDQQKKYSSVKEIKDKYFQARRAAVDYEREARRIREEKRRAENDAYHRGRRQEVAREKLDDASAPAYQEEIRTASNLISYFDPSSMAKREVAGPGKFAAAASRTVEDGDIKGTRLQKKGEEEENYFIGGGGKKKGKKNRGQSGVADGGSASPAPEGGKFNLDIGTIDSLGKINVDPPMSQSDVPAVVEKLKEKLNHWKGDQDRKTKENVSKAQAEIDKLEAEANAADAKNGDHVTEKKVNGNSNGSAHANAGAEQKEDKETNNIAEATNGLDKVKIETEDPAATEDGA
ncbi:multicopy suppressor of BFA (Brefeldin A) [Friedmanniomyces endolithicus]|uniref:Multicopy suppressor of BFA (Brefeldin A) n=1 Tax=Friedmanniomyces endolithicus TaxID=329885 RepID=A0AAN6J0U0_9PEZI|nr:multicopy suppressor of BFA (Brefeldin A) [Friedmanniomyces endolithicus]KAK0291522.1 multicopy suppressor of BFA (Brefeldin A) [Friedmanniomyces endolithicus]KAK0305286.1 multicopy suppressor of BFA (Brefeldin A) [Friedmanniomyces endolithicus]KAK0995149.1 multicopy suppressor of BFA (Brefeldin A) [Friedmanniomyces endolithicus]